MRPRGGIFSPQVPLLGTQIPQGGQCYFGRKASGKMFTVGARVDGQGGRSPRAWGRGGLGSAQLMGLRVTQKVTSLVSWALNHTPGINVWAPLTACYIAL